MHYEDFDAAKHYLKEAVDGPLNVQIWKTLWQSLLELNDFEINYFLGLVFSVKNIVDKYCYGLKDHIDFEYEIMMLIFRLKRI